MRPLSSRTWAPFTTSLAFRSQGLPKDCFSVKPNMPKICFSSLTCTLQSLPDLLVLLISDWFPMKDLFFPIHMSIEVLLALSIIWLSHAHIWDLLCIKFVNLCLFPLIFILPLLSASLNTSMAPLILVFVYNLVPSLFPLSQTEIGQEILLIGTPLLVLLPTLATTLLPGVLRSKTLFLGLSQSQNIVL